MRLPFTHLAFAMASCSAGAFRNRPRPARQGILMARRIKVCYNSNTATKAFPNSCPVRLAYITGGSFFFGKHP